MPRIPDPTTAGDFTRRFDQEDILALEECINRARVAVWKVQPEGFLKEAFIDVDGTIAQTYGECKEGMIFHPPSLTVGIAPNSVHPLYRLHSNAAWIKERSVIGRKVRQSCPHKNTADKPSCCLWR